VSLVAVPVPDPSVLTRRLLSGDGVGPAERGHVGYLPRHEESPIGVERI